MTWSYRILDHGAWLGLHEVHYEETGAIKSHTEHTVTFACETWEGVDGIIGALEMALNDARNLAPHVVSKQSCPNCKA